MTATSTQRIARSTLIVIVAFAAAKVISFAQTFIIASVFGASAQYDAFVIANRVPEQIFNLLAGGAIAFAFIPVFTGLLARDETDTAWKTASYVLNTIFLATLIASVTAFLAADWLISAVVAPGFDAAQQAETVALMRILLVSTVIFSISGLSQGILQSHNLFLLPALAPIMFDIGILLGVALLIPVMGVYGIAWGAVIGAALHLAVQIPGWVQVRFRWRPALGWNDANLRRILILMLPRMIDLGVVAVNAIIVANLLSRLPEGSASAYDWGWRLMQIPETLIGTAMGVVIFPTLAALSALDNLDGKRRAMSGALRFILVTTIPSAVILIVMGRPLVSLLERGAFDAQASALVYAALVGFAVGVIIHSVNEIIARSFYADKDTFTPLWTAIVGAVVNVVLSLGLSSVLQVGGLALANTLAITVEVILLMLVLRRRWRGLDERTLVTTSVKALLASGAMALVMLGTAGVWSGLGWSDAGTLYTVAQIGVQLIAGGAVFIGTALLLRLTELQELLALVRRRAGTLETATPV